jgi:hypothetical protein
MADTKATGLSENTAPVSTDLLYMVDDPGGTPASEKVTFANASKALVAGADTQVQYNNGGVFGGDADLVWDDVGKALTIGASTATAQLVLPQSNDAVTPTLAIGTGAGFYQGSANQIRVSLAGAPYWEISGTVIRSDAAGGTLLRQSGGTSTNPVNSFASDTNTGTTGVSDQLSLIAGGIEGLRITAASSISTFDFDAGDNGAEQVGALTSLKSVSATVPGAAAATITASNLIPAGSFVVGITGRVETTFGGAVVSMNIGDGSDADRWGAAVATAGDTTWDLSDATAAAGGWFTTATSVVFTGDVAFEASGSLDVIVHYFDLTAATA